MLVSVFFVFLRIYAYFSTSIPLGYDPGFYFYLFKKYAVISPFSFNLLPLWIREMYQPGIPLLGRTLTIFFSPEKILIPLQVFFQILLFCAVYLLSKKLWDKKTALWTIFIFACSALQYHFYWYYYLKNIAALAFMILTLYFLLSKSYLVIIPMVLVFYFHQQTAVFLLGLLFICLLMQKDLRKYYGRVILISLTAGALYYLPTFNQSIKPLIRPVLNTFGVPSGSFYGIKQALLLSLPYLPFGLWGFWLLRKQKRIALIMIPLLIIMVIVIFGFFFSRRFIPFLDLFLIFFAGYGAAHFFKNRRIAKYVYISAMVIFITFFIHKTGHPLIEKDELNEIRMLSQTERDAYVLVTDNYYTPWVYGWSDHKPITPGFGEYDIYWTIPEWHQFWESDSRETEKNLLLKLPKPLYIYKGDMSSPIKADFSGDCFERINWRTYKFICEGG